LKKESEFSRLRRFKVQPKDVNSIKKNAVSEILSNPRVKSRLTEETTRAAYDALMSFDRKKFYEIEDVFRYRQDFESAIQANEKYK